MRWPLGLRLTAMLGVAAVCAAQEPVSDPDSTIRVEVNVVNLPITVTDFEGKSVNPQAVAARAVDVGGFGRHL